MHTLANFQERLMEFSDGFGRFANISQKRQAQYQELELLIGDYSNFITDKQNAEVWEQLERKLSFDLYPLVMDLRERSAFCVALMEKYRASQLRSGKRDIADYFQNIESGIEREFGSFPVNAASKVLLVGSGSFPMTPLLIAKRTGAQVIGIDIDEEAIELGYQVINQLGGGLNIRLEHSQVQDIDCLKDITHIIFSSTVASKYEILDELYAITNEHVVVAMRYGNRFKSLFNYPLQEVSGDKWKLVENILRPYHVFDVALYQKA